jgi:HAD superfamily hydrolase (TIGR01484 family)
MLTDVDNTITPTDETTKIQFANFAKELKEKNNVSLFICPISGRDSSHVSMVMEELDKPFQKVGLPNTVEIGAGDQGGVYAFRGRPEKNRPIEKIDNNIRSLVRDTFKNSTYSKFFSEEEKTKVINIFEIKSEYIKGMSKEDASKFLKVKLDALKSHMEEGLGKKVHISQYSNHEVGVLEVVPKGVGKHVAINKLFSLYQKRFDIVGMCYCGDHENDMKAINYMSKLAEVGGIKTHIFIPKNAKECTKHPKIEDWQIRMGNLSRGKVIRQGRFDTLKGILEVMKNEYYKGSLIGEGLKLKRSQDDSAIKAKPSVLLARVDKDLSNY